MSATDPTSRDAGDPVADAEHRQALRILLEAGIAIVRDLQNDPGTAPADKAQPYECLARAVRRSILLDRHIAEHPIALAQSAAAKRTIARRHIIRAVEDAIERETRGGPRAETLRHEFRERLDAPDLDDDIAGRSIEDVIRDIRRDLGLDNMQGQRPWPRRTPAAIRALEALAAAPAGAAILLPQPPANPPPPQPGHRPQHNRHENNPFDSPDDDPDEAPAAVAALLRYRRHVPDG